MMESGLPSKTFSGVRFALVGFNPTDGNTLRSKLMSGGGVESGQYNSTHLIVDKIVYDDPVCVAARSTGKVVVTASWVHHSFDLGTLIDANSVLYRPLRDLNGIPGAKSLIVCLTGYLRQDREDIMTMVDLMGGQFSKPLVANRVTHLICYKFEGEKYELAKRMKRIKVVNHRWLEDCLKNWKLLPEDDYEISGHELEMMEASARDSEDEAEDAFAKRANTSPLGLRVGSVAAAELSKSKGKDIPAVQANSYEQGGSSLCNTSKEDWLTPKKMEAAVSTGPVAAQQSAGTFQKTTTYASPVPVSKTSERGMDKMETDESTPINVSIRRHSSLATYSRKTLQRTPETSTLGNESSCQDGTLKRDDRGLQASTAFNISALKSGSSVERTTLFEDLDMMDKLHGEESTTPLLPQSKLTDGSVSSNGSEKIHHSSEASIPTPACLLLPEELRTDSPKESRMPVPSIKNPTERMEVDHKAPDMSTAENIISKCAPVEVQERSSSDQIVGNTLLQEPRSGSPKQNLSVVPNINDNTEGKEVAQKVDVSDSATRLCSSRVMLKEADSWTAEILKGGLDEVPERSVTEPGMMRSSTSPVETEPLKKKTAPRKSLGTRGRKKNPISQKGSIYLSEPTPKDEHTDGLIKGNVSASATDNGNQKEISSHVLDAEAVPEMVKRIDSETEALLERIDSDKLQAKIPEEADAEVEIRRRLESELTDVLTKDPSDGALQFEVSKSTSKRTREATVGKNSLQSGKKGSSSRAEVGNSGVKKTKKSRKDVTEANETDMEDQSAEEMENIALENKLENVSSGGDQSPAAGETLVSTEAETKDPSDAAVQLGVDKNGGKLRKKATVEKNKLQSGKKRSSTAVESDKASAKKAKKSKKDYETEENDTVMNDIEIDSAEVQENVAVDKKPEDVSSDGTESPVGRKPLAKKGKAAKTPSNAAMQLEVQKKKRKNTKEATVERSNLQSGEKESSSTVEAGTSSVKKPKKSKKERGAKASASDTAMEDVRDNSAEEKENTAADDKSGRDKSPRKKAAKSAKTGTKVVKESKQLSSGKKALEEQKQEPRHFIVSGPKVQRKEYQKIIRVLKGKCCRDSHQWSYQATHFIAPEVRRTEKFFAAAASGSWILKTDYVADSKEAGKLLPEEPYEWHSTALSADGSISLQAPRKWRLVKERTGHGALHGVRIVVYGDCSIPSLDTLKRAVKAGDGTILATAPPYTRFLNQNTDFALISPGTPLDDAWVQEFIRNEIPCVLADYIVEYVCKPGYPLDKHVLYNTHTWAERSFNKLQRSAEE